ncbi:hypothetical protein L596_003111 [Steinernema carpocapsae]|uniref:Protein Wnt n=2 Tax=Steinernema carpocapsae TaxID=34508 RepID=A0A4U8URP0_STECR|nr:hypothetical protein L596_003111 [Steinernema carpocapsae]
MNFCVVTLFLLSLLDSSTAIAWLALGMSSANIDRRHGNTICENLPGLTSRQRKFCRNNMDTMESLRWGARTAYAECQFQFTKRRWNCTMIDPTTSQVFGDVILREGTREAAFVHAISAAGVAYRVTKDCARGIIDKCGCDMSASRLATSPGDKFNYNGCSDNVQYGVHLTRQFVNAAENRKDKKDKADRSRIVMNMHNNRAGREVLLSSLRRECKCHGLSGSCEMKTCWDAMPPFREIGTIIKDKFDGATEVQLVEEENRPKMIRKNPMFKRHTNADLVYMDSSPDYCEPDLKKGVLGTQGRQCNISSLGIDGCDLLCCHRGYERLVKVVQDKCNCKFHYCCRVDCEICNRTIETHICK